MIKYNVTVRVDPSVEKDWIAWMRDIHIPDVMATGLFLRHEFSKLIHPEPIDDATSFIIQYWCNDIDTLNQYFKNAAPALQKDHVDRYGEKCLAFRTIMEEI